MSEKLKSETPVERPRLVVPLPPVATDDLINGLKHMASDHPCCAGTIALAVDRLSAMQCALLEISKVAEATPVLTYQRMEAIALHSLHNAIGEARAESATSPHDQTL